MSLHILKPTLKLSVIIPARNEFPNVVHTIYSVINCLEADGFTKDEWEIIIVDNGSTDNRFWPQTGTKGTTSYLFPRGIFWSRQLRVLYDPICGNHSARNKGAKIARGEYLYFSDAHMAFRPGFFKSMIQTCKDTGGLVHGSVQWMGAYPPHSGGMGYGYTFKLGEEWKMTWNNYKVADTAFAVAGQGHWGVMVNRDQFLDFGGYPDIHRTYGGGEVFVDCLWWMLGSSVVTDPNAIGYHLSSGRGYTYHHDDYVHNIFNCGFALGADDWIERAYINYMRRGRQEVLARMLAESKIEMADRRKTIDKRKKMTFNELIVNKPWDKWNQEKHGNTNSSMLIYHWSWLELLEQSPDYVKEAFKNSVYQKQLAEFIEDKLSLCIYKGDRYTEDRKAELRKLL
ncbi:glycosyltransferase family 2 protein [Candidatus Woesearchaeota archaeon]|nr:glycosyltransferase family 2 protein [Candidatus Woesearchaeota archaeon]